MSARPPAKGPGCYLPGVKVRRVVPVSPRSSSGAAPGQVLAAPAVVPAAEIPSPDIAAEGIPLAGPCVTAEGVPPADPCVTGEGVLPAGAGVAAAAPAPQAHSVGSATANVSAAALSQALLPALLPSLHQDLRGPLAEMRRLLDTWHDGLRTLEQTLAGLESLCGAEGDGAAPDPTALLPLLQALLARAEAGDGDLVALLAHPALAGLLGRQS